MEGRISRIARNKFKEGAKEVRKGGGGGGGGGGG
jgi:hypothetical protein